MKIHSKFRLEKHSDYFFLDINRFPHRPQLLVNFKQDFCFLEDIVKGVVCITLIFMAFGRYPYSVQLIFISFIQLSS